MPTSHLDQFSLLQHQFTFVQLEYYKPDTFNSNQIIRTSNLMQHRSHDAKSLDLFFFSRFSGAKS